MLVTRMLRRMINVMNICCFNCCINRETMQWPLLLLQTHFGDRNKAFKCMACVCCYYKIFMESLQIEIFFDQFNLFRADVWIVVEFFFNEFQFSLMLYMCPLSTCEYFWKNLSVKMLTFRHPIVFDYFLFGNLFHVTCLFWCE